MRRPFGFTSRSGNGADYKALRAKALSAGAKVVRDMPQISTWRRGWRSSPAHPDPRGRVDRLVARLKGSAVDPGRNATPPLSATDTSAGDLSPVGHRLRHRYCPLAGSPIGNREAYGAGLLNVARP